MGMVNILIKWPRFILFYQTALWFRYVCDSQKWVALDVGSKISLTFGAFIKPVFPSRKYYDFCLNSYYRKMKIFKDFSKINALGFKFGIAAKKRSRSTHIYNLCKPGRSHIHNVTKAFGLLVPEGDIGKGFYVIWTWRQSWSWDQWHFSSICPINLGSLHMKFKWNGPSGF